MTTDKTPATLATVKHGGCVQLPTSERERFEAWAKLRVSSMARAADGEYVSSCTHALWRAWQAALSAQPSPGGSLPPEMRLGSPDYLDYLDTQPSPGGQDALSELVADWETRHGLTDAYRICAAELKEALAARQPVGQITDAEIDARLNALYREMVDSGQHNGGMSGVAWDRAVYRMAASRPAQAVDLEPALIPDTPEVRDILGRPSFWCSPWANILRRRGDVIPCKAEEEQAAVILFMLNHYLAHGAGWAEAAEAELQAIRYQVTRNG